MAFQVSGSTDDVTTSATASTTIDLGEYVRTSVIRISLICMDIDLIGLYADYGCTHEICFNASHTLASLYI